MTKWLLDTNVISETRKSRPSRILRDWIDSLDNESICTSVVNIAELRFGAQAQDDLLARESITKWVESVVRPKFENRIFDVTEDVLVNWRIMSRKNQLVRAPTPPVDILVAAIAWTNHLAVATHDVAPFVACGVPTLNPWTGERFNGV